MRTGEPRRTSLIFILLIAAMLIMLFAPVYADSHKCQGGHNCNEGGDVIVDLVGGDNTAVISGGRSYGVAGSDYDIGQCMYHAGGLTIAIGFRNKFCEGMDMIRSGMVAAGVLHICKQTKIGRNYDTLKDCKNGLAIVYVETSKKDTQGDLNISKPTQDDEDDDRYEAVYARLMDLEAQRTIDVANTKKAVQRANAAVEKANKAESAQRAYAQQALEELKEWN